MMNALWTRLLKSAYRQEPITSFVVTVGVVDVAIGGLGASGSLFSFGLGTVGVAIALRWWLLQRSWEGKSAPAPELYLPPSPSGQPLPMLSKSRKNPPY